MDKIKFEHMNVIDLLKNSLLPKYQRTLVWKKDKQQDLIISIMEGYPIGAITVFEIQKGKYQIIDGLQRLSTIKRFMTEPKEIFSWSQFRKYFDDLIKDVFLKARGDLSDYDLIINEIRRWYESDFFGDINNYFRFQKETMIRNIINDDDQYLIFEYELTNIFLKANIDIPILIYSGDESNLPEIFDRINSGSVLLSKYEFYAARWSSFQIKQKTKFFDTYLNLHYSNLDDVLGEKNDDTLIITDVFQLLISYSNFLITNEYISKIGLRVRKNKFSKQIISNTNEDNLVKEFEKDDIAFELLSIIFGYSVNQIDKVVRENLYIDHNESTIGVSFLSEEKLEFLNAVVKSIYKCITIIGFNNFFDDGLTDVNYHSYYVLLGIFYSEYKVDVNNYKIIKRELPSKIRDQLWNFLQDTSKHREAPNFWFISENRQISFFIDMISELKYKIELFDNVYS